MKNKQWALVSLGVCIVVSLLYFYTYNEQNQLGSYARESREYEWTGLPISIDNDLFYDPSNEWEFFTETKRSLKKYLSTLTEDQWDNDDELFLSLTSEYTPMIGWNGFFDALNEYQKEYKKITLSRVHWFGEVIYADAKKPHHAIEITSRDILHKATLHGAVWAAVSEKDFTSTQSLFDLVNNELCYFRTEPGFGNTYMGCAHGVGHGLAKIYVDDISLALDVCAQSSDKEFQYSCATGVYMDGKVAKYSFSPCDTNRFPACCYRFRESQWDLLHEEEYPCSTQCDPYHKMGCIYGRSFVDQWTKKSKVCDEYLPSSTDDEIQQYYHAACIEGYYSSHSVKNSDTCSRYKDYPISYEICMHHLEFDNDNFTLSEDEDEQIYYNVDLLEKYYNPNSNCEPVPFPIHK